MRAIFISYRRDDAEGQAGRLFKDLVQHFGDEAVFMDVAGIEPGRDFRKAIDQHVSSCGVLLALIGKNWVDAKNDLGVRRLEDSGDFVRLETASALKRDIPVVPVLVHGALMPRADQLPDDLKEFAFRNAIELTHARWDSDLSVLIKALGRYVQPAAAAANEPVARPITPGPAPSATSDEKPPKSKLVPVGIAAAVLAAVVLFFALRPGEGQQTAAADEGAAAANAATSGEPTSGAATSDAATAPDARLAESSRSGAADSPPAPTFEGRKTLFGVADWDGDGHQDLIARHDATADLILYPGQSRRGAIKLPPGKMGISLKRFTPFGVVDWDGDGHADIVTRNDSSAALTLYPGSGRRATRAFTPVGIGVGWSGYTVFGAADWDRDGHADVVVRNDTSNELMLYPGEGVRRMSQVQPTQIGVGWGGFTPFGMADWDGDGKQDIVTRNDTSGDLMLYPGENSRSMSQTQPSKIGEDLKGYTFFGMADWDSDGHQDLIARDDATHELWLYPGESSRGTSSAARVKLGSGF
jgi:hypothetical protein